MDEFVLKIFQSEVKKQCDFAIFSFENIESLLENPNIETAKHVWFYIQGFLVSAANVSKLLWAKGKQEASRAKLRERLNVTENNLREVRDLRNSFEHFDEKLMLWSESSITKAFIDSNIGPIEVMFGDTPASEVMRHFDPTKGEVIFRGDSYKIHPVYEELKLLKTYIEELQETPR